MATSLGLGSLYAVLTADIRPLQNNMRQATSAVRGFSTDFRRQMDGVQSKALDMNRVLSNLGTAILARKLIDYADQYTLIQSKMNLATHSAREFANANQELEQIALRTRTGLKDTTNLYYRMERSTRDLSRSQQDLFRVTEMVNKSVVVSGEAGVSAQAALVQFSQGLQSGVLRGEELNSVLEQAPVLAQQLAAGLKIPIGALRDLGQQGKLTTERIFKALLSRVDSVNGEFKKMEVTVASAFTALEKTALVVFLGKIDQAGQFTQRLSAWMMRLAEAMIEVSRTDLPNVLAKVLDLGTLLLKVYAPIPILLGGIAAVSGSWGLFIKSLVKVSGYFATLTNHIVILRAAMASPTFLSFRNNMVSINATAARTSAALAATGTSATALSTGLVSANRAAVVLRGTLATLGVALTGLFAAWAGWEIGTWINDNFAIVRQLFQSLLAGVVKGWIYLSTGAEVAFTSIVKFWTTKVVPIFANMPAVFGSVWDTFKATAQAAIAQVKKIFIAFVGFIPSLFAEKLSGMFESLANVAGYVNKDMEAALLRLTGAVVGAKVSIDQAFVGASNEATASVEGMKAAYDDVGKTIDNITSSRKEEARAYDKETDAIIKRRDMELKEVQQTLEDLFFEDKSTQAAIVQNISGLKALLEDQIGMREYVLKKLKDKYERGLKVLELDKAEQRLIKVLEKENAQELIKKATPEYQELLKLMQQYMDAEAKIKKQKEDTKLQRDFLKEYEELYANDTAMLQKNLEQQVELYRQAGVDIVMLEEWRKQKQLEISDTTRDGITRAAKSYFTEISNNARNVEQAFNTVASSLEDTLVSALKTGKLELSSFLDTLTTAIAQMFVIRPLLAGLGGALGFKDGGVFSGGGNVQAFANGGIVGTPTYFPMSQGRTGLMGEAGPEAIIPLTRTKGGQLGVTLEGAGAGQVTVQQNLYINENVSDQARQEILKMMPEIQSATVRAVTDAQRRNGGR